MSAGYRLVELAETDFSGLKNQWQDCLSKSRADPIFASWSWMYSWWEVWSAKFALKLAIFMVEHEGTLVGIAPLYSVEVNRKFGPKGSELQFIGSAWHVGSTIRTEHTNLIIAEGHEQGVCEVLRNHLRSGRWQDLVISDHPSALLPFLGRLGPKITQVSEDEGIVLDVSGEFSDWLKSLGKNTRLKVYNRRNYLGERLELASIDHRNDGNRAQFLHQLKRFSRSRYEREILKENIQFHDRLSINSADCIDIKYSYLRVDGEVRSIAYDLQAGGRRYNLALGFSRVFDKKVSLGLMHLGFLVEEGFEDQEIARFDFLAGGGKNTFYKEHLKGDVGEVYTLTTSQVSFSKRHYCYLNLKIFAQNLMRQLKRDSPGKGGFLGI